MSRPKLLSNQFFVEFSESDKSLLIYSILDGKRSKYPIELRLEHLQEMGKERAMEWVGETLMLLIPTIRSELLGVEEADD